MSKTADEALAGFSKEEIALIRWMVEWRQRARPKQLPPDQAKPDWTKFGILTGRGFGKSLALANWLGQVACKCPNTLNAVVAPTHSDVQTVCFEGPTGLLSVIPESLITDYTRSQPITIKLKNNSIIRGYAGDSPERLRGPQFHNAWLDEVASFQYPEDALSNLELGLRLGDRPRMAWSTTPKPRAFLKELIKDTERDGVVVRGTIFENRENLPQSYLDGLLKFHGTKIGDQELLGQIIDIEELGIVKRSSWRLWPHDKPLPRMLFIVMSLDCATTEKDRDSKTHDPDFSACSVWGMFEHQNKRRFMLLDFWQERLGLPDLITRVRKERQYTYGDVDVPAFKQTAFGPLIKHGNYGRRIDLVLVEQQGGGRQLLQMLATEGILCHEYNPGRLDKLQRLHMVSPAFVQGLVYVVESETHPGKPKLWADESIGTNPTTPGLISQVCSYAGKGSLPHDDALDCTTGALRYLIENHLGPMTVDIRAEPRAEGVELIGGLTENPYSA
jgi:phage terminase large subunit-like protein